ncbi:MAG: response regulator transcription factor [Oscillospiraceae bacterium]|nr:response regulator transcription factor [Oscillospiraceae bacterium]
MSEILIIEDDTYINNLIFRALSKEGYSCQQAFSGTEGLLYAKSGKFSLAVLDLMLPGINGEELLPKLKNDFSIPVIVLSAKDSLDSKIDLLNAGADDYMTKPFEIGELIARIGVQLRRSSGKRASSLLTHKKLVLNLEEMSAEIDGQILSFTKHEYKILELFMENPSRVFTKQDIYDYAWDDIYIGEDKTVNMHISNIRKKLKAVTDEEYIETVWGIGFKLSKS